MGDIIQHLLDWMILTKGYPSSFYMRDATVVRRGYISRDINNDAATETLISLNLQEDAT